MQPLNWKRLSARLIVFLFLAAISVLVEPRLIAVAWHLTHAPIREFGAYRITVPDGVFAYRSGNELRLVGAKTILAKKFFRFAMVTINQTGKSIDLDRFDAAVAQIAAKNGTSIPDRFRTEIGGTPMACTQQENVDTAYLETDCLSTDGIQLYYVGDLDTIGTLRAVVEGAQKL
jgi:hypothetical protein